jgi:uncharacterized protein (TIGR00255 family)
MNNNLHSMTGYGRVEETIGDYLFTIEVKCLNSKGLDLNVRTPYFLRDKEMPIRTMVAEVIVRGKVEVYLHAENLAASNEIPINWNLLKTYTDALKEFAQAQGLPPGDILNTALRLPDVQKTEEKSFSEENWNHLQLAINKALSSLKQYRKSEGDGLHKEFKSRIDIILDARKQIEIPLKERNDKVKNRLQQALEEFIPSEKIDANRFEQEMIYYLEKLDVSEEQQRLLANCEHFIEELDGEGQGKKLGFIAQEIGREINTIGSKANDATLQRWVVVMKDELEKIKEQINNVL